MQELRYEPMLKLAPIEENLLKQWMHDELHYTDKCRPRLAKKLQLEYQVVPAHLAEIIAAWMPNTGEQWQAAESVSSDEIPEWPWASPGEFQARLAQARAILKQKHERQAQKLQQVKS